MEENSQKKNPEKMITLRPTCFAFIVFMTFIISVATEQSSVANEVSLNFTVFFSGNVLGELDACG